MPRPHNLHVAAAMPTTDPLFNLDVPLEQLGLGAAAPSPIGGSDAAASLLSINDPEWELVCKDVAHKQEMLDYASERGIPTADHGPSQEEYRADDDLAIGMCTAGLVSYPPQGPNNYQVINDSEFRAMCDAYAARALPLS